MYIVDTSVWPGGGAQMYIRGGLGGAQRYIWIFVAQHPALPGQDFRTEKNLRYIVVTSGTYFGT